MYISPINIIKGLKKIVQVNIDQINDLIHLYRTTDELHIFQGLRKTLPLSAYPSLEFQPVSASSEWSTTQAQTAEYVIDCYLTVKNDNEELNAEYISQVSRKIIRLFNYPSNLSFPIPNQFYSDGNPIYIQFGNVQNITYRSTRDRSVTVAQFTWSGRVLEYTGFNRGDVGPIPVHDKTDVPPGQGE